MDISKIYKERFALEKEYLGTNQPVNKISPKVSVCIATYQHADFIKDCLDGALMQKTDFDYEIIIGEDESTDGTREICIEYAEKYPDKIRLFLRNRETSQLYDNKGNFICRFNGKWNRESAHGKYIALCEGDDYWTDPLKLQKQVDFLEGNPDYYLAVGGFTKYNVYTKETEDIIKMVPGVIKNENGYTFELDHTSRGWITKTLTAVFRNDKDVLNHLLKYRYGRDVNLFYHILKKGKGFYFTEIFGVYTIHTGGIFSMQPKLTNKVSGYNLHKELHLKNKDEFSRKMRFMSTLALFNALIKKNNKKSKHSPLKLYVEAILLFRHLKEIKYLIAAIIK